MSVKAFATLLLTLFFSAHPGVPSKIGYLMYKWAPLVKLAQNELWRPSSVDFFLSQCKLEDCSGQPNANALTSSNLERCTYGKSFIVTKDRISCPSCTELLFFAVRTQVARVSCQHTSSIESITISWKSPTGCSSHTTMANGSALGIFKGGAHARRSGDIVLAQRI